MSLFVELVSWFCFLTGGFFCVTGGVGLLRFPDFFSRVHAAGVTETLATPLFILGLMLQIELSLDTAKLLLIVAFILATNPTATHAMSKAALRGGLRPWVASDPSATKEGQSSKS